MSKTAIIAVAVVAIVVVAGVGGVALMNANKSSDNKVEYDTSKGWYSWDPTVVKYPTGSLSFSPKLIETVENMYKAVYGDLPDYSKYKMEDVPEDFLTYESSVFNDTEDQVTIISKIRVSSSSSEYKNLAVTVDKTASNKLITVGSNAALLEMMFESTMTPEQAKAKVWDYVWGLDKSAYSGGTVDLPKNYGMEIPNTVTKVGTTYYLIKNLDEYTGYVDTVTSSGSNLIMMFSGALANSYADMKPFYNMMANANATNPGNAYLVGTFSNNLSDVFAGIEMVGAMFNVKDIAHSYIDSLRLKFWAMHEESSKLGKNYEVYIESASGTGAGTGTIIDDVCTTALSLKNICDHQQWKQISNEVVVDKQPHVLFFQESDKRTDDERMRVGVGLLTS